MIGELKPCPFCGGEALTDFGPDFYRVFCPECNVKIQSAISLVYCARDKAIERWNTRAGENDAIPD